MIRALMQKLGLDQIGDVVADEAKRVHIEVLREEREILARMIAKLDERIAGLGGKPRGRPPKAAPAIASPPTRRPRRRKRIVHAPGETLRDMVVKALAKAGGPVKATTLVDLVLEAGYKTNAKRTTLVTSTYTVLADTSVFRRMGKGVFGLKWEPAIAKRAAKAWERRNTSKGRGTSASPATPSEELQVLVLRAFRQSQGPMTARQVARRVRSRVPRANCGSKDLLVSVEQVLADRKLFRRVGSDRYELALPGSTKRKVGRPRKHAKPLATQTSGAAAKEEKAEASEASTHPPVEAKAK